MTNRSIIIMLVSALVFSVAGCQTLDPYTGEKKTSSTVKGSAIGAGIGALLGYVTARDKSRRDRRKAILIGAGVGGVSGAAIGNYMDRQEYKLRQQLEGTGVSVTRNGDELILNMPGNITFATGSAGLKPNFSEVLKSVVLVLNEFNQTLIETAGHTDSVGSSSSNKILSDNRSRSVGNFLIDNGVSVDRVLTIGFGEERPIADNKSANGRQLNRRVELTLIPIKTEG